MSLPIRSVTAVATAALIPLGLLVGSVATAGASSSHVAGRDRADNSYTVHQILSGTTLTHTFTPAGAASPVTDQLSNPDDITELGNRIFVGFQNGVGPQGQASVDGNLESTVVELKRDGDPVAQWDVAGKADGVSADPQAGTVIVTVNEDLHSSFYTIDPNTTGPNAETHYSFNESLPHNGGTDAISIYDGQILISASAPGTTGAAAPQPTYPAVYSVTLDPGTKVATVAPLFSDEDQAIVANIGGAQFGDSVALALTDPDSNEVVPAGARFGGDFMLASQGDQEQIYLSGAGRRQQKLSVLSLSQSVDDTAWPTQSGGTLYSTDSTNDSVDSVVGPFSPGQPLVVATPSGSNSAPTSCPAPPSYPANYLAGLNPMTGQVTAVTVVGAQYTPEGGLLFVPHDGDGHDGGNE